jgi:hypothetical protein
VAPLKVVALAAVLASVPVRADAAVEQRLDRWTPYVAEASARFSLPSEWIRRVIRAESGGRTHLGGRPIVSRAGAMGLMQLMPATWAAMRARLGLGEDPHDPRDNILAGTAYLRLMYDRFGYPGPTTQVRRATLRTSRQDARCRPRPEPISRRSRARRRRYLRQDRRRGRSSSSCAAARVRPRRPDRGPSLPLGAGCSSSTVSAGSADAPSKRGSWPRGTALCAAVLSALALRCQAFLRRPRRWPGLRPSPISFASTRLFSA